LASGVLTGKYINGIPEHTRASMPSMEMVRETLNASRDLVLGLQKISKKTGISMSHLALGWCALNPNVSTVILGASRLEQLKENLDTLTHLRAIQEIKSELDSLK
jgi:aryl-alcohol dehydrogenase-like predicted oxidoreductase